MKLTITCLISAAACVFAQNGGPSGPSFGSTPIIGWLATSGMNELRPIAGVLGASSVGDPVALPRGVSRVHLAPAQPWAIVEQGRKGDVGLIQLASGAAGPLLPIDGAVSAPGLIAFSPNGRSAVLVSPPRELLQVVTGLDGTPRISIQAVLPDLGPLTAAALSDDATLPLVLGADGSVYLPSPNGTPRVVVRVGAPASLAFLPGQSSIAIADGLAGTISVLDGLAGSPTTRISIAAPSSVVGGGLLLGASGDGRYLIAAAAGTSTANQIDLSDGSAQPLALQTPVTRLDRLRKDDVFLFAANPGEAAWMVQPYSGGPRAGFSSLQNPPGQRAPSEPLHGFSGLGGR